MTCLLKKIKYWLLFVPLWPKVLAVYDYILYNFDYYNTSMNRFGRNNFQSIDDAFCT